MSHFAVVVVTKTPDDLDAALQPFHEYECTGTDDQYVIDVDVTEEVMKTWKDPDGVAAIRLPDGTYTYRYGSDYYEEPTAGELSKIVSYLADQRDAGVSRHNLFRDVNEKTGLEVQVTNGHSDNPTYKVRHLPEGAVAEKVSYEVFSTANGVSLEDWAKDYGGWKSPDGGKTFIRHTNPNAQWDWWSLGGRWRGQLQLKPGATSGNGGDLSVLERVKGEPREVPGVDQALKGDVDWEAMRQTRIDGRQDAVIKAYTTIKTALFADEEARGVTRGKGETAAMIPDEAVTELWVEYSDLREDLFARWKANETEGKPRFWEWAHSESPRLKELEDLKVGEIADGMFSGAGVPLTEPDPLAWVQRAPAMSAFAFLTEEGEWVESGKMGWWGMVADEKDPNEWADQFQRLLDAVPADRYLSVVDCHI